MKKKVWWIVAGGGIVLLGLMLWLLDIGSWQQLDMNKLTELNQTTVLYDAQDTPVASMYSSENRLIAAPDQVPKHVKNAFVAIEDARFYEHHGVDLWRIGGAVVSNIKEGGYREGASTITQQLIKLTHLTSVKKLSRKAQEAWLAIQLEKQASKEEILGMYLNVVYFGRGAYGIETAAQTYFGKSCSELTLAEGALLAGVIKAPGTYAPHLNPDKSIARRNLVLDAMCEQEMISSEEAENAKQEPLHIREDQQDQAAGWYVDWTLREAGEKLKCSAEEILSGGYRIYTSMNADMQNAAEELFEHQEYFPGNAADGISPEAALVAMNPENGEIFCMIGGRNYQVRQGLNRAMQIRRQPGSAFKPISVYAAAIDLMGYTPISLVEDVARDFGGGYTPGNASGVSHGTVTLRQALVSSMNLATLDLMTRTGINAAKMYAERAGIRLTETDNNLSLALGSLTEGVSPAELSAAYAPLTNGGHRVSGHTLRRIEDLYGRVLYQYQEQDSYVMSEKSAYMLTEMLQETASKGTAKALKQLPFPVAAKTGTVGFTNGGNRDTWTVAYTPAVAMAVWMGYDQPDTTHVLPNGTTGGTYPARLAAAFLANTQEWSNGGDFTVPGGMTSVLLDRKALTTLNTPMLASERTPGAQLLTEVLPNEKLPVLTSTLWDDPKRVDAVYVRAAASGQPMISFISPDSNAQYRIMRAVNGDDAVEAGRVSGAAGMYLSFTDEEAPLDKALSYYVLSRHTAFEEEGSIVESEPSETVTFKAPGLLERLLMDRTGGDKQEEEPLFGERSAPEIN